MGIAVSGALALPYPSLNGNARWVAATVGIAFIAGGGALSLAGLRGLGRNLTAVPRPRLDAELVEHGVYGRLRHPIYSGIIAGSLGWALVSTSPLSLVFVLALAAWFDLKARREEQWLTERYAGYAAYVARTRRFIPWVY